MNVAVSPASRATVDRIDSRADARGRRSQQTGDGRPDLVVSMGSSAIVYAYGEAADEYTRDASEPPPGRARNDFRQWDTCEGAESPGSSAL